MDHRIGLKLAIGLASMFATVSLVLAGGQEPPPPPPPEAPGPQAEAKVVETGGAVTLTVKAVAPAQKAEAAAVEVREVRVAVPIQKAAVAEVEAVKVEEAAAPAQKAEAKPAEGDVDPQVQQWIQQFRPTARAEYSFLRSACAPTQDQRRQLARDADRVVKEVARKFADQQKGGLRVIRRRVDPINDPHKLVREELARAAKDRLTPEQWARFKEESDQREADRRRVSVLNLVTKLDQQLVLSAEQRDKLVGSLSVNWHDEWGNSLQSFVYDDQYLPPIPDEFVVPVLTEPQKKVWQGIQKVNRMFWGGVLFGGLMDNRTIEEEEAAEDAPRPTATEAAP